MPKMTKKEYQKYVEEKSPKSSITRHVFLAFLVGGLICLAAQGLVALFKYWGMDEKTAATVAMISMVFLGAALTGIGVYDKIAKHAGAGTVVPITGFANSIVSAAMEFKAEGFVTGLGAKMFTVAGPVIVFGTIASVVVGLVHFLFAR